MPIPDCPSAQAALRGRATRRLAPPLALALAGTLTGPVMADAGPPGPLAAVVPAAPGETQETGEHGGMPTLPSPEDLQQLQAAVGSVAIDVDEIFDENDAGESGFLYRLANDLHPATRESTIREQLLFHPGEKYSVQKASETARLLRSRGYLADAEVVPTAYDPGTNTVDMKVRVHDVWTLEPGIGFGRSGGANKSRIRIADENFLGLGQEIALERKSNEDRSGVSLQFHDPNLLGSWWALDANVGDTSDGRTGLLAIDYPFYSLDSRWSAGLVTKSVKQVTSLYDLGEVVNEFDSEYTTLGVEGGISDGLVDGWTRRWLFGYRYDRARFDFADGNATPSLAIPGDRRLAYPWLGIELIEDRFATLHNRDQIGKTEDVFLGKRLRASLGWAAPALGADRSAGIFSLEGGLGRALGEGGTVLLDADISGRVESGTAVDSLVQARLRYHRPLGEHDLFFASVEAAAARDLDLDQQLQLGGDNGLRGYPLRYQSGEVRTLLTLEERHFTDWYPFRLFRVGGAVFADLGRMWGEAPLASEPQGWLGDVGFGLRLGNGHSGIGNVLHIDLAFPIAGSGDVDAVQVLVEARKSF